MMIDAHTTFAPHWDTLLCKQWHHLHHRCGVGKPIISAYAAQNLDEMNAGVVHHICRAQPITSGKLFPGQSGSVRLSTSAYRRTPYVSCNYLFAEGSFCATLSCELYRAGGLFKHVFWGEEAMVACIAYTTGYDVYTPPRLYATHQYYPEIAGRPDNLNWRKSVTDPNAAKQQQESEANIAAYMDPTNTNGPIRVRSVREFWQAAGFKLSSDGSVPVQSNAVCTSPETLV